MRGVAGSGCAGPGACSAGRASGTLGHWSLSMRDEVPFYVGQRGEKRWHGGAPGRTGPTDTAGIERNVLPYVRSQQSVREFAMKGRR